MYQISSMEVLGRVAGAGSVVTTRYANITLPPMPKNSEKDSEKEIGWLLNMVCTPQTLVKNVGSPKKKKQEGAAVEKPLPEANL